MIKKEKGQIWVSAVLYLIIGSIVIILLLQAGIPLIMKHKEMAVFTKTQDMFISLDNVIVDLIDSGAGSQRVLPFEITDGTVNLKNNTLRWVLESDTKILEPRTDISLGNLKITSDIDVNAYDYPNAFVLENSHIKVNISKIGNPTYNDTINTDKLIKALYLKDPEKDTESELGGTFNFTLANEPCTASGTGYTELIPGGNNTDIALAKVLVHMHTIGCVDNHDYTMELSLDSKADFIAINILDFK